MRALDQLSEEEKLILSADFPKILDFLPPEQSARFHQVCEFLKVLKVEFIVDQYLVRGLDYYRDTVFEIIHDGQAIAGGGCYAFNKNKFGLNSEAVINGLGWAMGLERVAALVKNEPAKQDMYIIQGELSEYSLIVASKLRDKGNICLIWHGTAKECYKKAASLNASHLVLLEKEDVEKGILKIKSHNDIVVHKLTEI